MIHEAGKQTATVRRIPKQFQQLRRYAFGSTVRQRRLDGWLSREVLGGLIGRDADYIKAIEDDQLMPCLDTVFVLADALDLHAGDLLHDVEQDAQDRLFHDLRDQRDDRAG